MAYTRILVPVDLAHLEQLEKALTSAADLARHYGAAISYVSVTAATPGSIGHNPQEFARALAAFGRSQAEALGVEAETRSYVSHDPAADLDETLIRAIDETGADLVVMASHIPGFAEHLFASNAGYLAAHAKVSVFVVR